MINQVEWIILDKEYAVNVLNDAGYALQESDIRSPQMCRESSVLYYETVIDDTVWEIDLETGETRHRGLDEGCFWTEWE